MVLLLCNLSPGQIEANGLLAKVQPGIHTEVGADLGAMVRPPLLNPPKEKEPPYLGKVVLIHKAI